MPKGPPSAKIEHRTRDDWRNVALAHTPHSAGLARESREKSAIDHTAYGLERCSPKEFAAHHTAAISAAIQLADVLTLRNAASSLQFSVSYM